jgi:hypothetical protein
MDVPGRRILGASDDGDVRRSFGSLEMANAKPWFIPEEPAEDRTCGTRRRDVYVVVEDGSHSIRAGRSSSICSVVLATTVLTVFFAAFVAALFWDALETALREGQDDEAGITAPLDP